MREAQALSQAGDLIPPQYRNKPGACLLAMDWAHRHDVALYDVLGHVAFFGGKATVEARLQRQMAARSGYFTKVVAEGTDPGQEFCTVAVFDDQGRELGRYTMTHDKAKLLDNYKRNANYQKSLDQMLLARATTRALDRYATAPTLVGVFVDEDEPRDPVEVLESAATAQPDLESGADNSSLAAETSEPDVVDAVIVEDPAADPGSTPTGADLKAILKKAGMTQVDLLRQMPGHSIDTIAADPELWDQALDLIEAAG
jgi:hypothetical protein